MPESDMSRRVLESILLPGTPEDISAIYLQLEEEARTRDFGLLEEDVVVLDTETTGLSFHDDELIEIAAARLRGREIVDRFQTFVKPSKPIPPEITALTGIRQLDVEDAPKAKRAVADLAKFVGGSPVLAHNMLFDRTFIERVAGGGDVSNIWIDTLSLSRIALPRLSSHRLADLADAFGCESVSHRAMADVEALCGIWRVLLCGIAHLPEGLCGYIASMHEDVRWSMRPVFSHIALEHPEARFSLAGIRKDLFKVGMEEQKEDSHEKETAPIGPTREELAEEFGPDGIVSRMYESFEKRPEQIAFAQRVLDSFMTSTHLAAEAGTGVGKSIAYLLPSLLFARANNVGVGVATKTNALTDQLVYQELPALSRALNGELRFSSLKGYDHYPCLRQVVRAAESELPAPPETARNISKNTARADMLTATAVVLAYVCQSPEGDLDALGIRWRNVPRDMLTTTPEQCTHGKCPFFPDACLVHGARRRAACSDIVVTNHSLLLRNVEAEGHILPPIRHWIVDEAHSFESEARRQWAKMVSPDGARAVFEALGGIQTGAIHTLITECTGKEAQTLIMGLLTKASAQVSRASVACADFFDEMGELRRIAPFSGGYDSAVLWIGPEVRQTPEWAGVSEMGLTATERLEQACKSLEEANAAIADGLENAPTDLLEATRSLRALYDAMRLIISGEDTSYVYSAELSRSSSALGTEALVAEKLDIGHELAERWLPEMESVVFTSATMAVGEDFTHFNHAVGLDRLERDHYRCVQLDSSYDFDNAMSVVVAKDLPDPRQPGYLERLIELLYDVHIAMDGSVLTLFTNRREMEQVYEALRPRLSQAGLNLLVQERRSSPRQLRQKFMREKSASLLALKSFWEGFDAGGETLRCVVIPKLPFSSPNDPLSRERDIREDRSWWNHSLPEAVLSVKQAAGRLIRTATDTGILILADSRLVTKSYGSSFVNSMPSHTNVVLGSDGIGRYIETWRKTHE